MKTLDWFLKSRSLGIMDSKNMYILSDFGQFSELSHVIMMSCYNDVSIIVNYSFFSLIVYSFTSSAHPWSMSTVTYLDLIS